MTGYVMGIYSQKLFTSLLPPPPDGTVKGSSCYSRRKLKTGKRCNNVESINIVEDGN